MILPVDLSGMPEEVRQRLHEIWSRDNEREMFEALGRQQQIARFYHQHELRATDGLGEVTMAVDPYWLNYFRWLHGSEETDSKEFRDWLKKREPMFRVKSGGTKTQVGYGQHGRPKSLEPEVLSLESRTGERRYRKTYA